MKRNSILIVLSIVFFFGLSAANLFAQDQDKPVIPDKPAVEEQRVIVEELVLSDPTVAKPKKWLIGLSAEYWYVHKTNDTYKCTNADCSSSNLYTTGTITGQMPGGTITVGYDKFTVSYSYRKGNFDSKSTLQPAYTTPPSYQPATGTEEQTEHELTLRVLLGEGSPHFNPYLLLGYNYIDRKLTETLDTKNWIWNATQTPTRIENITMQAPFVGLGAIIPFNKYVGMRLDGRFLYIKADYKMDNATAPWYPSGKYESETLWGFATVGTFYWNIWEGLNLQVGGKWQYTSLGDGKHYIDESNKYGAFGMLGWVFRF